jgi:hypothetical protein
MQLIGDDAALFVSADSPWKSLADLERAIRQNPGQLKASGTAQGGIWHVSLAGWLDSLKMKADDVNWISINGSGPSLQELLSGGVSMVCCALPEAQTLLDAGQVRCLGVMADDRLSAYPAVPTFREQGYPWSIAGWRGLALPRGVPKARFETMLAALNRVVLGKPFQSFMASNGFNSSILEPKDFSRSLARNDAQFEEILTSEAFRSVRQARYGPYVFPSVLAVGLSLAFLTILFRAGWKRPEDEPPLTTPGFASIALAVVWVVAFVLVMNWAGYVITGTILLMALLLLLRVKWPVAVAVSVLVVPLSYQIFAVGLRVPLPWGWLGW